MTARHVLSLMLITSASVFLSMSCGKNAASLNEHPAQSETPTATQADTVAPAAPTAGKTPSSANAAPAASQPVRPTNQTPKTQPHLKTNNAASQPQSTHPAASIATTGDPQIKTDHPWFPGELSCSTFDRLFKTQSALYTRVTGRDTNSDEDKAIASWYWRNLNEYHMMSPKENFFHKPDPKKWNAVRDYWSGLFAYGFALCGTTHAQYTAEMEYLLGHCRARVVGVRGHNTFEVFLKDPQYGKDGDWALLDHDISTIVFDDPANPKRLMSLWQVTYKTPPPKREQRDHADLESILDNENAPDANRGWFISGLYFTNKDNSNAEKSDAIGVYTGIRQTEPLAGYAAVEPMVSLKRGEMIRRYLKPGLGKESYVFWGASMPDDKLPGPARGRTWVTQPEKMYRATQDTPWTPASYGNAVYTYTPSFKDGSYIDGVIDEGVDHVTFYFYSPYAIAATPAKDKMSDRYGVYDPGGTHGLVITAGSTLKTTVQISTDNGQTWSDPTPIGTTLDLTDLAKGHHSYHLKFNAPAKGLAGTGLTIKTICIANDRLIPHLKDNGSTVTYQASGKAVFAAGPNIDQAQAYVTGGGFGQSAVELTIPSPNSAAIRSVYAVAKIGSGCPPDPKIKYQIDYSTDGGKTWSPIVKDWTIDQLGYQTGDWWSESFCYGKRDIPDKNASKIMIRFRNNGGKKISRAEVYLVYKTPNTQPVTVTFNWTDNNGEHTASHVYPAGALPADSSWTIPTGDKVVTNWVEMSVK